MEDGACEDQSIRGLIPRVFEYLFSRIEDLKAQDIQVVSLLKMNRHMDGFLTSWLPEQVVCKCSYLEIYNEAVTDLLSDSAAPITIRDDPRRYHRHAKRVSEVLIYLQCRGVVIEGAKEVPVANASDTFKALSLGSQVLTLHCMLCETF